MRVPVLVEQEGHPNAVQVGAAERMQDAEHLAVREGYTIQDTHAEDWGEYGEVFVVFAEPENA